MAEAEKQLGLDWLFKEVRRLTNLEIQVKDTNIHKAYSNLGEEFGEVARAMNHECGFKVRKNPPDESGAEEVVDVILQALELYLLLGGTQKQFLERCVLKLAKWERKLKNAS